jgi:hypothetical protein
VGPGESKDLGRALFIYREDKKCSSADAEMKKAGDEKRAAKRKSVYAKRKLCRLGVAREERKKNLYFFGGRSKWMYLCRPHREVEQR